MYNKFATLFRLGGIEAIGKINPTPREYGAVIAAVARNGGVLVAPALLSTIGLEGTLVKEICFKIAQRSVWKTTPTTCNLFIKKAREEFRKRYPKVSFFKTKMTERTRTTVKFVFLRNKVTASIVNGKIVFSA